MNRFSTLFFSLSVSLAVITWSNPASAAGGWYLGFALPYNSVDGDFKGNKSYSGSADRILVPKVGSGLGWGIYGGIHATSNLDWELNYLQTNHNGTYVSTFPDMDATYSMFNINLKYFVNTESTPIFVQAGYGSRDITVKGGAVSKVSNSSIGDVSYLGNGFNFGIGLTHPIKENIIVTASALYYTASFDQADGTAGKGKLPDSLEGSGLGLVFGIAYDIRQ